jgi:hypothetical protein
MSSGDDFEDDEMGDVDEMRVKYYPFLCMLTEAALGGGKVDVAAGARSSLVVGVGARRLARARARARAREAGQPVTTGWQVDSAIGTKKRVSLRRYNTVEVTRLDDNSDSDATQQNEQTKQPTNENNYEQTRHTTVKVTATDTKIPTADGSESERGSDVETSDLYPQLEGASILSARAQVKLTVTASAAAAASAVDQSMDRFGVPTKRRGSVMRDPSHVKTDLDDAAEEAGNRSSAETGSGSVGTSADRVGTNSKRASTTIRRMGSIAVGGADRVVPSKRFSISMDKNNGVVTEPAKTAKPPPVPSASSKPELQHQLVSGYLNKKGSRVRSWKTRYFMFNSVNRRLQYYENEKSSSRSPTSSLGEGNEKGELSVTGVEDFENRPDKVQHRFNFCSAGGDDGTGKNQLAVAASSAEEKQAWLAELARCGVPVKKMDGKEFEMKMGKSAMDFEGYLNKKGHNVRSWKKRYFVLKGDSQTIGYFESYAKADEGRKKEEKRQAKGRGDNDSSNNLKRKGVMVVKKVKNIDNRLNKIQNRLDLMGHDPGDPRKVDSVIAVAAGTR